MQNGPLGFTSPEGRFEAEWPDQASPSEQAQPLSPACPPQGYGKHPTRDPYSEPAGRVKLGFELRGSLTGR